jgi:hypothetical protein
MDFIQDEHRICDLLYMGQEELTSLRGLERSHLMSL